MRKAIICIVSLLLLSAVGVSAQNGIRPVIGADGVRQEEPYRAKWALLIGINEYPNLPANRQLHCAENDANEMKKVLMKYYQYPESNITTLFGKQATYQGIMDNFIKLSDKNRIGTNDCVLVYFSGHGHTVNKPISGELGFLIPYDARVDLTNFDDMPSYYGSCIGMDKLKELSVIIPAKHIIFLVDSCYSGLAINNSKGERQTSFPNYLKRIAALPVREIITAGSKDETVNEESQFGHSIFTYKLLEALRTDVADENDDGVITGVELASHLKNVVTKVSNDQTPLYKQTPQFGYFSGEGEFLFIKVSQQAQPTKPDITLPQNDSTQPAVDTQPSSISLPKGITGSDDAPMALIPAGEFQMGSSNGPKEERPVHTVFLDAFYIDKYEITNKQYRKFIEATGHKEPEGYDLTRRNSVKPWNDPKLNGDEKPVVCVNWEDATAYAKWVGKRLPTEAEWEKAARGGLVGKKYPWGDTITHDDANYKGTGGKDIWEYTSPVSSFAPNGYELYDMAGNVWEWCADWYDSDYYKISPKDNPKGPSANRSWRILRGCPWNYPADNTGVSLRGYESPYLTYIFVGFRCVQDVPK